MGKKKHKKIIKLKDRSDSEIIQAAERAETASRLKEAAEFYKELNKRYPAKYDDSLLRVQIGRYKVFIQNRMYESANQLVTGLRGQISTEKLKAFELSIAVIKNDNKTIDRVAWEGLSNAAPLDSKTHLLLLESLIFSDSHPPDSFLENSDVQTLLAVREGFVALCAGNESELSNALSKIPRSSVLAHWKLLLRALEAWYAEDEELLEKCLRKLTDVEGKGAQIVQGLELLRNKDCPVTSQSLNSALGLHDIGNIGDSLMEMDEQVSRGNLLNAFKYAQKQFPRFIDQKSDVDQIMVEGFVSLYQQGASEDRYREFIDRLLTDERKPASLRLPFMRANYKAKALNCLCFYCILQQGKEYLSALEANGITSKESAHLKYHLAHRLVNETEEQYDRLEEDELEACSNLLQEAREEDPTMVRAGLLLSKCYLSAGAAPKGNALLDELAKEFPEDPAVLFAAGCRCIERKTYVRGLRQLEQAYAIDPHLPELEAKYVEGLLAYALQCYGKNMLDKGRTCFEKMKPHLRERSDDNDFTLGSRWMRLRQLEMEASYGDPAFSQLEVEWEGKENLREAFAHLIAERVGSPERIKEKASKLEKFFKQPSLLKELDPDDVCTLQAFIKYNYGSKGKRMYWDKHTYAESQCLHFIKAYRMSYAPERLEGILKLLWSSIPDYVSFPEVLDLTKLWSKADRRNPQLKLMHIMALQEFGTTAGKLMAELDKAMDTARSRGDEFALHKGSELQKEIEKADRHSHFDPVPGLDYQDNTDDEDEDFEEDDYFDEDAPPEKFLEGMYDYWRSLQYEERKSFEAEIKRNVGKAIGRTLINGFKARMKADKQAGAPADREEAEKGDTAQLDFSF